MKENKEVLIGTDTKYEQLGYWEPLTLGQQLRRWAEIYKDRTVLVEDGTKLTYSELNNRVDELAAGFLDIGIKKKDNVVVQLPNRISFVITCFALFRVGAVPVLSLPAHREAELDGIFSVAKPVAYIIPAVDPSTDYKKMAEQLCKKHSSVNFIVTDGKSEIGIALSDLYLSPLKLEEPPYLEPALLLLSGGTTDIPKLIPRTHADYVYNAKASARRCGLDENSVYLAVLPIAHNFPLCCPGILGTMSVGGKIVLSKTASYDEVFPLIEKEKVTITSLVPAMVNLWLEVLEWDSSNDLSSLKVLQVGGSMLDKKLAKRIMPEMNCKLQQVFGTAEGLICCTSLEDPEDIINSCQGRPISEADEIKIVDEDGNEVEEGEYGELIVRGPYTIKGYYKAAEQNQNDFTEDGFYRTGDKARLTCEGNIQIGGRIKEQINRAGEKIMPSEIEAYLCCHPNIKEAALVGIPDENLGQRSCAFLITENGDVSLSEIRKFMSELGVARYKMPDQLKIVDVWPLTSVGKIDKNKLKKMADKLDCRVERTMTEYIEEVIKFEGEIHLVAAQIIETGAYENYLLYENKDEISLGLGVHSLLTVDSKYTTVKSKDKELKFENDDLSETIEKAFTTVELKDFRAYGTVNFGLARYNHNLPLLPEEDELIKLFIPEVEVRLFKGSILLRALDEEKLKKFTEIIEVICDLVQCMEMKNNLAVRVESQKLSLPFIYTHDSEKYMKMVAEAVREIQGKIYQKVILSRKIPLGTELDMVASYIAGRKANTPARSYIFSLGGLKVAGYSPETVVEVDSAGWVSTFPLAGTRSRGVNEEEELKLKEELINDPKEIAEHAVSVKLAFEELESVCDSYTISVDDFMFIAKRGTVQHLASRLKGKLKPNYNSWHAFNALFPAVTASGIPKKESIEAISRLETQPRNLYSGCVMTFDSNGAMDAALVLRSIYQKNGEGWLHAGAGIVEMSLPERELEETREKLSSFSRHLVAEKSL